MSKLIQLRGLVKCWTLSVLYSNTFIWKHTSSQPVLYLTFDDGPHPEVTPALLRLLLEQEIKATFFVVGQQLDKYPEIAQEIVKQGHAIANHSYNHPEFSQLSFEQKNLQWQQCEESIEGLGLASSKIFRAPRGRWDLRLLYALRNQQMKAAHWSRDSMDFKQRGGEAVVEGFRSKSVQSGDIILFHDDNLTCVDALASLIPDWKKEGFSFKHL